MKKMRFLLTFFLGLAAATLLAQTNVSGIINSNTTFSIAGSPYTVTSSITVASGITLTIESGVTVKVAANQSINVNGTLTASGATITSAEASPTSGDWNYISIGDGTNSGTVSLTDCQVIYADYIYLYNGSATLTNTNLQNFYYYGAYGQGSSIFSMNGGSISTSSSYADDYGSAIYAIGNASMELTNVSLSNFYRGVYQLGNTNIDLNEVTITSCYHGFSINENDTLSLTDVNVSGTTYPIYYNGAGNITTQGTNVLTGNTNNVAYVYFSTLNKNWKLPSLPIPFYFYTSFTVNNGSQLTVGSGNILKSLSSFTVNGTLTAEASASEYIYFTSHYDDNWGGDSNNNGSATSPSSQNWGGLSFTGNGSSASSLYRCKIRYGGSSLKGGINFYNSNAQVNACEVTSSYFGLYISGTSNPSISNTIIGSSTLTPVAMSFESDPVFTNNVLSFSDNQYDAIGLIGGTLTANATIKKRNFTGIDNITYFLLAEIIVPENLSLTIDPGIVIKADNYSYDLVIKGTLKSDGTPTEPIVFTSVKDDNHGNPGDTNKDGTNTTPTIGNFSGIVFTPTSNDTSSVTHCIIKYADCYGEYYYNRWMSGAAIITINVSPTISNNEIKDVNYGIKAFEASNPVIADNKMVNIVYTPFAVAGSADPVFSANNFVNVGWNALGLIGGNVSQNGTIKKRTIAGFENITYVLLENMTIKNGTYIDVEPGVVIKMNQVSIFVEGGFKADGTPGEKIIFTSTYDDNNGNPGDTNGDGNATSASPSNWNRIRFQETSDDSYCLIDNAEIRYGGNNYYYYNYSNIEISNANPTITNTLIGQSDQYGIRIEGNSAPIFNSVTVQNCKWDPVGMSLTSNPQFTNMNFVANRTKGLAILEGTLAGDATLISRNVAGIDNIAYILNTTLTIASNATLTINPGVVIKSTYYGIEVNGALVANGTPLQKITFTSINDDGSGGDTNDDGNNSVPASGNWNGIWFKSSGIDHLNSLTYTNLRYGNFTVKFEDCKATMQQCVVEQSSGNAFQILGSASPNIGENQIFNIYGAPVYMSMFSEPVFSANTMANIGMFAIQIAPETYSQSDTFPFRSFAGYDSITYLLNGTYTITDGTTITIPAGMVFKTGKYYSYYNYYTANFNVNGKLLVEGTEENPVIFTSFYDDSFGNPSDMGEDGTLGIQVKNTTWFKFNNVSDDASLINQSVIRYSEKGIELNSASANITNNRFEYCTKGIYMNGVSEPTVTENTFHNLTESPITISLVAYPVTTENNVISGTTYRMIEVNTETLTQDVTLPKRSFGGVTNIPYLFNSYTIGTGAILTIEPGVICKFKSGGISVQKGLIALGTSGVGNSIVFTSYKDDFYGGDSNSDSTATSAAVNSWGGITFENTSIDASCVLDYCVVKFAGTYPSYAGVNAISSSPSISNCSFISNGTGVVLNASSNPTINFCDFYDNTSYGINNIDKTFTIDATNNWWGNNSGPTHINNVGGTGQKTTDAVNYTPWLTQGANQPILGDVSLNGQVQAYDASLILQHTVNTITLETNQLKVADVSGNGGIDAVSAYDASLILQYNVGIIDFFPASESKKAAYLPIGSEVKLIVSNKEVLPGELVSVPLTIENVNQIYSLQTSIKYNQQFLTFKGVEQNELTSSMNFIANQNNGTIQISLASVQPLNQEGVIAQLLFEAIPDLEGALETTLSVEKFLANDKNLTEISVSGTVTIFGSVTSLSENNVVHFKAYPNPFSSELKIAFHLSESGKTSIEVYNSLGQRLIILLNNELSSGLHEVIWNGETSSGIKSEKGIYIIKIIHNNSFQTLKVQMF